MFWIGIGTGRSHPVSPNIANPLDAIFIKMLLSIGQIGHSNIINYKLVTKTNGYFIISEVSQFMLIVLIIVKIRHIYLLKTKKLFIQLIIKNI